MGRKRIVIIGNVPVQIDLGEVRDREARIILTRGMDLDDGNRAHRSKFVEDEQYEEEPPASTLLLPLGTFERFLDGVRARNHGRIPDWLGNATRQVAQSAPTWTRHRLFAKLYGRIKHTNWYLDRDGMHAVALPGATLWELAQALTGSGTNWPQLKYEGNPKLMMVGTRVNVQRWVMRVAGEIRYAARPDGFEWFGPIPDDKAITTINMPPWLYGEAPRKPGPESLLVRRARERHWKLEGATATAQSSAATLEGLAEAITGNKADCNLLEFPGESRTLSKGDSVNIMLLLKKAAGEPVKRKAREMRLSAKGKQFIKDWEKLVLYPYDDEDAKTVKTRLTRHTQGATIGWGHLIGKEEWPRYKDGISNAEAERLFESDVKVKGGGLGRYVCNSPPLPARI